MQRSASLPNESHLSRKDIELLAGMKGSMEALIAQVNTIQLGIQSEARASRDQSEKQSIEHAEQMKTLNTKIESLDLWRVTTITSERLINWDAAAERVGEALNDKQVARQEKVITAVEAHLDKDGKLEGLTWLSRARDRWAFLLTIVGGFLAILSTLFYWFLDNVVVPFFTRKGV